MGGDVEKMVSVGLVWGATNALMRRGAQLWNRKLRAAAPAGGILGRARQWVDLLLTWQYSLPFLINLSASAAFFYILGDTPISLAVPVTNATTFAATAIAAMLLGEEMRVGFVMLGTALVVFGVWVCIT